MKTVYVKGKKMIKVPVDIKYARVLAHEYEGVSRLARVVGDMVSRHAEDEDGSYINSDEYHRLFNRASEVFHEFLDTQMAIVLLVIEENTGEEFSPNSFFFQMKNEQFDTLLYQP